MEVEVRAAIRMEFQGWQEAELYGAEVTSEMTTGRSFMGSKMLSGSGWKERLGLSTGWSFKASKMRRW